LKSIDRNGALEGIGKPEKLKSNLTGYYSRRINHEHRLVYTVDDNHIKIASCKYHY
ncbi:TPA: Txe/YoeB family addiction module toxin, partial [Staphylococcus aureus]